MRQALRALMLLRTHTPSLSRPLPLNHPWRRTDPPALCLLGCIRARPGMVNYCECHTVGLRWLDMRVFAGWLLGTRDIIKNLLSVQTRAIAPSNN